MKYTVQQLDGRYSHNKYFKYCIEFSSRMNFSQGPEHFTNSQEWFFKTYGWSAEVRQWNEILRHYHLAANIPAWKVGLGPGVPNLPNSVNFAWSWQTGDGNYTKSRIYVRGDSELAFFQLAHPVDQ
jgi:hypothetical protein